MERYINVDETLKQIREDYTNLSVPTSWSKGVNFAIGRILRQPTEDVVKVVRCEQCKRCEYDSIFNQYWCMGKRVTADHYCGYGELRDGKDKQ